MVDGLSLQALRLLLPVRNRSVTRMAGVSAPDGSLSEGDLTTRVAFRSRLCGRTCFRRWCTVTGSHWRACDITPG